MTDQPKQVAVLGSTGSVGTRALEVIAASQGRLHAVALSAYNQLDLLVAQACEHRPRWIVAANRKAAEAFDWSSLPEDCQLLIGAEALEEVVARDPIDIVLAAIVGSAGLASTWRAIDEGKSVALANKETLVMAGSLMTQLAQQRGVSLLPVDSEHSAIFQALQADRGSEIKRLLLTSSGGPFQGLTLEEQKRVTVAEALEHPTWEMGAKITVDSATMMNKGLEIIEACWLFEVAAQQVEVLIHPQSVVHSMVEYIDGSVLAQLSPPDMRLPIQYALYYPERVASVSPSMDWSKSLTLNFEAPNFERFPALELGYQAAKAGGSSGAVLNAANEAAVALFLQGELHFTEIVPACRSVLDSHSCQSNPSLQELVALDRWAREEVARWICA